MAKLDNTDEVAVLAADLRLFLRALENAYGISKAWDLLNQFRQLDGSVRLSPLTKALEQAQGRIAGYLEIEEDTDDDVS